MTKTGNILKVAFRALARNKLRSLLTALGIIIGVACVVAVVGIGEGARMQAESQLKSLGTNFLMVIPGSVTSSGARAGFGASSKLSAGDKITTARTEPWNGCGKYTAVSRSYNTYTVGADKTTSGQGDHFNNILFKLLSLFACFAEAGRYYNECFCTRST